MAKKFTFGFRRKRLGKTNYKKRLTLLKSRVPRVVIRKTSRNIIAQIIEYQPDGDKILVSADSKELKKYGWNMPCSNLPSAYLTGLLLAQKAKSNGIKKAIADLGLQISTKGSRLYALLKGLVEGGFNVAHSKDIFPDDERVSGKHIVEYAKSLKENKTVYEKRYSGYLKLKQDPEKITEEFNKVKEKIGKGAQ